MPTPNCYAGVQLCRLRVVRLDADGNMVDAADNTYVHDKAAELTWEEDALDGIEILERDGCGDIGVDLRTDPEPRGRGTITLTLLRQDPPLLELLTGGTLLNDGVNDVGLEPRSGSHDGVVLEAWSKAWDGNTQATSGGVSLWYRFIFPKAVFSSPPFNLGNQANRLVLSGQAETNTNVGTGPVADWPASITRPGAYFQTTAIPAAACGYSTLDIAS